MIIENCKVRVTHSEHGYFEADSQTVGIFLDRMFGDVNFSRRSVAAFLSDAISLNYFDVDEVVLAIVMASIGCDADALTHYMAFTSDEDIQDVYRRYNS